MAKLGVLSAALVLWLGLSIFAQSDRAPVVVITIDTLRADRVGGASSLTPELDRLASAGIVFSQAVAQVPITLPSHVSIMTGTYPMFHGIRDFGGIPLALERETLAEILKKNGYATAAFVSSFALDSQWGLGQGFDVYQDDIDRSTYRGIGFNAVERRGDKTTDLAIQWLRNNRNGSFFLWVHLFDPHDPYEPPEPFLSRFKGKPYDGEVAFADQQAGRLFSVLRELNLFDSALIVVMGDHGEGLGEHGEDTHGFFIYDTTIHIPLIIKLPNSEWAGTRVSESVQSIDVAPTVLQVLRVGRGKEMQGRGLVGLLRGGRPGASQSAAYSESLYARYHFGWSSLTSYRDGKYKFIQAPRRELFDLQSDPGETKNLANEQSSMANQYAQLLDSVRQKFQTVTEEATLPEVDEETRQRLQSLGYIALTAPTKGSSDDAGRADPKDKIELFNAIRLATIDSEKSDYLSSIQRLEVVNKKDPEIYTARYLQGLNLFLTNQWIRAVEEFKAALALFPEAQDSVHGLAMSYLKLGLNDSAKPGFERLIQLEPANPRGYVGLGEISLKSRDFKGAEEHFRTALKLGPNRGARLGLGSALGEQGRYDEAVSEFQKVLQQEPESAETHFLLGLVFEKMGRPDEARRHKEKAKQLGLSRRTGS